MNSEIFRCLIMRASLFLSVFFLIGTAQADVMTFMPVQSVRTSPCDNWGCCCGMSSTETNPNSISIRNCFSQGGYCGTERNNAAWVFEIPELPEGSSVQTMAFAGNRSGSYGSGNLYLRWVSSSALWLADVLDTWNSPDVVVPVYWSSSSNYSFTIPSSMYADGQSGYLMVIATKSTDYAMTLVNSGPYGARIAMLVEELCVGDFNGNGQVEVDDVLALIGAYGSSGSTYDLDGDSQVGVNDLLLLLDAFGDCP